MKKMKRTNQEIDAELYSTSILEDLLESKEWYEVDDILKLTFKAVNDILQTHAQSLKDVKALLTTRASKTQLNTGLSLKTNISDVSKSVEQLSKGLQERPSYQQITNILRDFASKTDIVQVLAEQSQKYERRMNQQQKQNLEISILKARMDDFQKQISKRVGTCVTLPQFQEVLTILQNKANINEINDALQSKVSKQYLTTALQKKVSKNDLDACLSKKADTADLDYLINSLQGKVNVATLQKLAQVLQNKADKSDLVILGNERNNHNRSQQRIYEEQWSDRFEQLKNSLVLEVKQAKRQLSLSIRQTESALSSLSKDHEAQIKKSYAGIDNQISKKIGKVKAQMGEEIQALRQSIKSLQEDLNNHKKYVAGITNDISVRKRGEENIYSEIDDVRKKLQEFICRMVEKKEFIDFKSEVTEALSGRVEIEVMQTALDELANELTSKIIQDKKDSEELIRSLIRKFEDRIQESSASSLSQIIEIKKSLSKKQERNDSSAFEDIVKRIRKDVEECRKTVDIAYGEIHSKISVKEYESDLIEIRKRFELIAKEISIKANIKDVCVLADSKPNIDDINTALREINQALADKVTEGDLQNFLKDQATINETLCSENIVGRWMWQSGEVKPGGLIPWESQSANTVPDHFFWEKDKTSILIIAAGVYEITACVFGKNNSICVLANGQQVNSNKASEEQGLSRKTRKRKQKQVGSTNICEYVMLPQRSRISVSVGGDASQGFINIRRL